MSLPRVLLTWVCCALCLSASGCIPVLVAGGALAGYSVSRDSVEGTLSRGKDEIFEVAQQVVKIKGALTQAIKSEGKIQGVIDGADVTVTIVPLSLTTTRLHVKARKTILPRVGTAQEVFTKILSQLEE